MAIARPRSSLYLFVAIRLVDSCFCYRNREIARTHPDRQLVPFCIVVIALALARSYEILHYSNAYSSLRGKGGSC